MRPDVWIPGQTSDRHRGWLSPMANVHHSPSVSEHRGRLGPADMLVIDEKDYQPAFIERFEQLRVVQTLTAGVDAVIGLIPAGVTLCDASGVHDVAVSEWIILAMLSSLRALPHYVEAQRQAAWSPLVGADLEGSTVLILGYGSIGAAVERRLAGFDVDVVRVARRARPGVHDMADLAALLPQADVVVVLLPLTSSTTGLVDLTFLRALRPGSLLINASRGAVVDQDALLEVLGEERIQVALDVMYPEPLPPGHPLWRAPGVILTPHIASDVGGLDDRAWRFVTQQVQRYARAEALLNVVADGY